MQVSHFLHFSFTSFLLILIYIICFPLCFRETVQGRKHVPICSSNWGLLCISNQVFPSTLPLTGFLFPLAFSHLTDGKGTAIHYSHLTLSFIMEADVFQEASLSRDKWNQFKIWSLERPNDSRNSSKHMSGFMLLYTLFEMNKWVLLAVCLKEINSTFSFLLRRVCLPLKLKETLFGKSLCRRFVREWDTMCCSCA